MQGASTTSGRTPRRDLFARALAAQSVAVVGASADSRKVGHMVLRTILEGGFEGRTVAINPNCEEILGVPCLPSLSSVADPLDLVVVAVPAPAVPAVVREAGAVQAAMAVVLSAGFRESGRPDLEAQLTSAAHEAGILVVGPNVQGLASLPARLCALMHPVLKRQGGLAIVGQSGSITADLAERAERDGLGTSVLLNLGNKADLDEIEALDYLSSVPSVQAVALYLEGTIDGRRLMVAAQRMSHTKPVVILKAGATPEGSRAVASHTASLAGNDAVFDAACAVYGIRRARDVDELYDLAKAACLMRTPRDHRLFCLSSSGGSGALAADEAGRQGLEISGLSRQVAAKMSALPLSPRASISNPFDLDAETADEFRECARVADEHDVADSFLFCFGDPLPGAAEVVREFGQRSERTVVVAYLGGGDVQTAETQLLHEYGIATYPNPERAVRALSSVVSRDEGQPGQVEGCNDGVR